MNKLTTLCLLSLAACATQEDREVPDGLTILDQTADRVSATFGSNGVAIQIELDDGKRIAILDAHGGPLLESTLEGDVETISVLGGRETIIGTRGQENPTVLGDPGAHDELSTMPEAELVHAAFDALKTTNIPEPMYKATSKKSQDVYRGFNVYCGQTAYLPTYSIWWSHEFVRRAQSSTTMGSIHVQDFWAIWDELLLPGWTYMDYGPRWNFTLNVTNTCWFGNVPVYVGSDAY
jgi:hypothetical protein